MLRGAARVRAAAPDSNVNRRSDQAAVPSLAAATATATRQQRPQGRPRHRLEATTILLGEPNPKIIDGAGSSSGSSTSRHVLSQRRRRRSVPTSGQARSCSTTSSTTPSNVFFFVDRLTSGDGGLDEGPDGQIYGNAAIFDFQETWDFVTIINESQNDIWIMDIDVVKPPSSNKIQIDVTSIPTGGTPATEFRVLNVGEGGRFHFEIIHSYIETVVTITADQASGPVGRLLNGVIRNAIGKTTSPPPAATSVCNARPTRGYAMRQRPTDPHNSACRRSARQHPPARPVAPLNVG
jgi:hypothetical protein